MSPFDHSTDSYTAASFALFAIGLVGVFAAANRLRKIMAANLMGSGVFLLLVATGYPREGGPADPVPQALVLTGIVVAVSATALALTLVRRIEDGGVPAAPLPAVPAPAAQVPTAPRSSAPLSTAPRSSAPSPSAPPPAVPSPTTPPPEAPQ